MTTEHRSDALLGFLRERRRIAEGINREHFERHGDGNPYWMGQICLLNELIQRVEAGAL